MYHLLAAAGPREQCLYLSGTASVLVEASARADLPDGALLLIDLLIHTPMLPRPSAISCGHLITKLLSLGRRADARRVLETLADRKRDWAVATVWRAGRAAEAVKVFGEMADTAAAPKHSRYRYLTKNMMNDCLMKGDLEAASELQTQMVLVGLKVPKQQRRMLRMLEKFRQCPHKIPRNVLIEICIMADSVDGAIRWLHHMGNDDMAPPNAHSYNLVLAGLWKAGRGGDAVEMFDEMADMSLAPNNFTYTVMIDGHLKRLSHVLASKKNESGDLEAALVLRAQMVQDGFKPDEYTYYLLMAELCLAERLGDVTALFHEMLIQGTTLHKIVHGSLFKFLFRINEDQLLGIVEKSAKDSAAAADNGCITLLKELCRIQKVSLAEKVLRTFVGAGLVPTTEMYNILVDGYCKIKELQGAFSLCRQMESHGQLVPNEATYEALLLAVLNNMSIIYWEDVLELFEKNGVSTDALNSGSSATHGFKYRSSLIPRMFNKLVSKLF
jgi:pentatricopeptide repeat protein